MLQSAANVIVAGPGERRLRATFALQAGRFIGSVWFDAQDSQELLREVFADEQPWPPSPPWQELHVHEQRGARALLLVGRAGASHWSMTVSADDTQRAIVFDVACRVRSRPEFLGTAYQLGSAAELTPRGVLWSADDRVPAVVLQATAIDDQPPATIELASDEIKIQPVLSGHLPATIRWKFSVRFAE